MNYRIVTTSFLLSLLFLSNSAFAAGGGTIKGVLKFHNKLGHFCSNITDGIDCTGSKYNEAAYDTSLPLSDVIIQVRVNGALAGSGATDINGNYQVNWTYAGSGTPTNAQVESFLKHKDSTFQVFSSGGASYRIYGNFTASYDWTQEPGNATGTIQNLGTWNWGSSTTPNQKVNAYSAAWRTWYYAFKYSAVLVADFGTLAIYAGDTKTDYAGKDKTTNALIHRVRINSTDLGNLSYEAVYHEMGHAASFRASNSKFVPTGWYDWPSTGSAGPHTYDSPEWSSAGFEEGLADFLGVVGQYWFNAPEARACLILSSNNHCPTTILPDRGIRLDTLPTCALTNENRYQRNNTRFLWDYYDSANAGDDTITVSYAQILQGLDAMADGYGNNNINEQWSSSSFTTVDNGDGRSLYDLRHMLFDINGISSYNMFLGHCAPPGSY